MPRRFPYRILFAMAALVAVVVLYASPMWTNAGRAGFPWVSGADGAHYALRLKAALAGDSVLSCPGDPALVSERTFVPNWAERVWAGALRPIVGQDVALAIRITGVVLPVVLLGLLAGFLGALIGGGWLPWGFALWGMLESGVYAWKPFTLGYPDSEPFPFIRYANPSLMLVPFLLGLVGFARVVGLRRGGTLGFVLAAGAAGLTFYTQIFYWGYLLAFLGLFTGICARRGDRSRARRALAFGAIALVVGAPALLQNVFSARSDELTEAIHRVGYLIQNRYPYFALHKSFLLTFVVYQVVCRRARDLNWMIATAAMIAGYLCLNQNLVTGLSNQDHHFFRPLAVIYIFVCADLAARTWTWALAKRKVSARVLTAVTVLLALAFAGKSAWISNRSAHDLNPLVASPRWQGTLEKLSALSATDRRSVLANPSLAYRLALSGQATPFVFDYLHHCIVPDELLYARWGFLARSLGWTGIEYKDWLEESAKRIGLPWWLYGLPAGYPGAKDRYEPADFQLRIDFSVRAFEPRSLENFSEELVGMRGGLPSLVIEDPDFPVDLETLQEIFKITLVFEVPEDETRVFRLEPLVTR